MPLDGVFMSGLTQELNSCLSDSRIDKVQMPEKDEVVLQIHGRNASGRLVISANSNNPRIHMTKMPKENPMAPPMFCMLLRKHLASARLVSVTQPGLERMIRLDFSCTDDFGEPCEKSLVCELMGRYSNIILVGDDGRIIDCLKRVDILMSEKRQVLPGMIYRLPPAPDKLDITRLSRGDIEKLVGSADGEQLVDKWLLSTFFGLSPMTCRELCERAAGDTHVRFSGLSDYQRSKLVFVLYGFFGEVRDGKLAPWSLNDPVKDLIQDFSCLEITQYGTKYVSKCEESFSGLLEAFYTGKDRTERISKSSTDIFKLLSNAYERHLRKLGLQKQELLQTLERDEFRRKGDILSASMHLLRRGMENIRLADFYNDGAEIEITLNPRLTPAQNITRYYREYNRMKTAERHLSEQIDEGEREIVYLESVLDELARAESEHDLREIREELRSTNYLAKVKDQKIRRVAQSDPIEYRTSGGLRVFAGRNNIQNDILTLRQASKRDYWFHVKNIPGAHVILETGNNQPPESELKDAALIAAYHSKANEGDSVDVDYTTVSHVKKLSGGKPGMVTYEGYSTARVIKDRTAVERLKSH